MALYNFTVRAEDERGAYADRTFSIQVQNNLVDKYLLIDRSHAYASTDRVKFTKRYGKGGISCEFKLNKWIVFTNSTNYRISDDTINWEERLSTKTSATKNPEGSRGLLFNINHQMMFEHSGYVYSVAVMDISRAVVIVRTNDMIEWELMGTLPTSKITRHKGSKSEFTSISNIIEYDGQFMLFDANELRFIKTKDFITFELVEKLNVAHNVVGTLDNMRYMYTNAVGTPIGYNTSNHFDTLTHSYVQTHSKIINVNGLVYVFIEVKGAAAPNNTFFSTGHRAVLFGTTDLVNVMVIPSTASINSNSSVFSVSASSTNSTIGAAVNRKLMKAFGDVEVTEYQRVAYQFGASQPSYQNGHVIFDGYIGRITVTSPMTAPQLKHNLVTLSSNSSLMHGTFTYNSETYDITKLIHGIRVVDKFVAGENIVVMNATEDLTTHTSYKGVYKESGISDVQENSLIEIDGIAYQSKSTSSAAHTRITIIDAAIRG